MGKIDKNMCTIMGFIAEGGKGEREGEMFRFNWHAFRFLGRG